MRDTTQPLSGGRDSRPPRHRGTVQKIKDFCQAFSEFLGRPKTVFDLKDRGLFLLALLVLFLAIEGLLWWATR
ncbi:MAG: hypothetical protein VZQ81_07600 [Succiniclasticum sp.]|jgi:hypothetical protein|nr:hypothetical protein [Succiniclasticum sp.]MEE3479872.1 hypothetical protein [Succiniclasticum sp.]